MNRSPFLISTLSAAILAACTPSQELPGGPALDLPQNCGAEGLQNLIGQPETALRSQKFAPGTRIIGPDDAITADYSSTRLNIELGPDRKVAKVACY